MKLRMHNVGFGDCFLLYTRKQNFIIDIGTVDFRHHKFSDFDKFIMHFKKYELDKKTNHALLTHYHTDHLSGFSAMEKLGYSNIFTKFYLPNITYDEKTKKILIIELAFYLKLICKKKTSTSVLANNILIFVKTISKLIINTSNIICVSRNSNFKYAGCDYEVLWPPKIYDFDSKLIEYLSEMEQAFLGFPEIASLKEMLVEKIELIYNQLSDRDNNMIEKLLTEYYELFDSVNELCESENFIKYLESIKYEKTVKGIALSKFYKKIIYGCARTFSKSCNALSVVFHEKNKHDVLMTGDITVNNYRKYIKSVVNDHYTCVKVPHHGTKKYYNRYLPNSDYYLIPIGDKYGNVAKGYKSFGKVDGKRICTLGHESKFNNCSIRNNKEKCKFGKCISMIYDIKL